MATPKKATRRRKPVEVPMLHCDECGERIVYATWRDGSWVAVNANATEDGDTYLAPHPFRDAPAKLAQAVQRIAGALTDPRNDVRPRYRQHTAEVCAERQAANAVRW